jgi:hypothetical protein
MITKEQKEMIENLAFGLPAIERSLISCFQRAITIKSVLDSQITSSLCKELDFCTEELRKIIDNLGIPRTDEERARK